MKYFKNKKIINGIEYMYKITPYYDPKTKKVRQKKHLSWKVYYWKSEKVVKNVFDYGELLPVEKIISHYKINKFLEKEFGKTNAICVIDMSMGRLLRGLSMSNIEK